MNAQLKFVGCGDAFGSGGRFNACFRIQTSDARLLIDCGASSLIGLNKSGENPDDIDAIVVSHFDIDHFGGVALLIVDAQMVRKRTRPLIVAGPPGLRQRLWQWIDFALPGRVISRQLSFDLTLIEFTPGQAEEICGVSVTPFAVNHFGSDVGAPPLAFRVSMDSWAVAYSGDTGWVDGLIDCAKDVDVFIVEALTYDTYSPYHLDFKTVQSRIPDLGAKSVITTHMSADVISRGENGLLEGIKLAHDGMIVELPEANS